jgi:predicted transcriptional regulator of viral defense system
MEFNTLLSIVGDAPVFRTGLLLAGADSPGYIRRQLSGWMRAGKVWQLRRGLYALAPPYQKSAPHPFLVANRMVPGSYVSLQSALAYYGLIPEYVPVTTSVTTQRPGGWDTPVGHFTFRHVQADLFFGYHRLEVGGGQDAFVASPEKALLDLAYLQPGGDDPSYLESLRLQNLDQIKVEDLRHIADRADRPKLHRAVAGLESMAAAEEGFESL